MLPPELRYRLDRDGLVVAGDLSAEETFELEELWLRNEVGVLPKHDHLRLLELYIRYLGSPEPLRPDQVRTSLNGARNKVVTKPYLPILSGLLAVALLFLSVM